MISFIQQFDHPLILSAMKGVTLLGNVPLYFIYLAIAYPLLQKRDWFSFLGIIVLSGIVNEALKMGFHLPRPPIEKHLIPVLGSGFPSGHAQMAVVVWGWIGFRYKQWGPTLVLMFFIGFSRLYLGVHYPSQVIGGWMIGFTILGFWIWKVEPKGTKFSEKKDDYAGVANRYDSFIEPLVHHIREAMLARISHHQAKDILDMCCGTGTQLSMIPSTLHRVGIDNSPAMLEKAKDRGLSECHLGEADKTPFRKQSFDLVLSQFALHEKDPETIANELNEIKRILKKDGRLIIVDFAHSNKNTVKSFLYKFGIRQIERFAGKKHFIHYKIWMKNGGLKPVLEKNGWRKTYVQEFYHGAVQLVEFSQK